MDRGELVLELVIKVAVHDPVWLSVVCKHIKAVIDQNFIRRKLLMYVSFSSKNINLIKQDQLLLAWYQHYGFIIGGRDIQLRACFHFVVPNRLLRKIRGLKMYTQIVYLENFKRYLDKIADKYVFTIIPETGNHMSGFFTLAKANLNGQTITINSTDTDTTEWQCDHVKWSSAFVGDKGAFDTYCVSIKFIDE